VLNPLRDASLDHLGDRTAGAVSLADCRAAGVSDDKLAWLLASGRWQSPFPRTFVVFSGPLPYRTMLYAALAYAGDGAALSHATAGHDHGLCPRPASVHLCVPYARQVDRQLGLVVHRSRTLTPADVVAVPPARTTVERTVLDLVGACATAEAALAMVATAVRERRTTPERLRPAFLGSRCARWRKAVLIALPDVQRGAQSPLELRDAALRRAHGLPEGRRQVRRDGARTEFLDVLIEEWRLHIELDGRLGHDRASEIWRDMRRDNASELLGLRHLRYGWADITQRPCAVAIEIAQVLRQQGWPGPFRRCPRCPTPLPTGL
jgi:very-short-patch-repair endonuclease